LKELSLEYIEELLNMASFGEGDPKHTKPIHIENIRADLQASGADVLITTEKISVQITDLLYPISLFTTREIQGVECAEFSVLAPRVRRVAVIGTELCPHGCYIMLTEEKPEENIILWRAGIQ